MAKCPGFSFSPQLSPNAMVGTLCRLITTLIFSRRANLCVCVSQVYIV